MTKATYPLKLPLSIKAAEAAADFFRRLAGDAKSEDLHALLAAAPDRAPDEGDERPASSLG